MAEKPIHHVNVSIITLIYFLDLDIFRMYKLINTIMTETKYVFVHLSRLVRSIFALVTAAL